MARGGAAHVFAVTTLATVVVAVVAVVIGGATEAAGFVAGRAACFGAHGSAPAAAYFFSGERRAVCLTSKEKKKVMMMVASKGFGRPTSSPSPEVKEKPARMRKGGGKKQQQQHQQQRGGGRGSSIQESVMQRTEQAIRRSMDELRTVRPLVWEALELKKKLTMWQSQTAGLNVLQLANLPSQQVQEMKAAETKLGHLQEEHGISDRLLHNIAQEATWDASARVKDERQANVELPQSAVEHMQAVVSRSGAGGGSRVMDVGTGTGILLRFLQGAGVQQENFVGVDLSARMIQVASKRYPKGIFFQGDFLDFDDQGVPGGGDGYTHVFFNGCLHNFLEPGEALAQAARLLRNGGNIIISHPKGAANVDMQRRANPMLVPNRLPTARDLEKACDAIPALAGAGMRVVPDGRARGGRPGEGYLQVLQKKA